MQEARTQAHENREFRRRSRSRPPAGTSACPSNNSRPPYLLRNNQLTAECGLWAGISGPGRRPGPTSAGTCCDVVHAIDTSYFRSSPSCAWRTQAHENDCVRVGGLRPPSGGRRPPPTRLLSHHDSCGRRSPTASRGEAPASIFEAVIMRRAWETAFRELLRSEGRVSGRRGSGLTSGLFRAYDPFARFRW